MANSLNTITVDGVTYDAEQYATTHAATAKPGGELDKDAFLQLLVAQMKYQDPLNPQDNSEYVAELANFSALEQMTNVAENIESLSSVVGGISSAVTTNTTGLANLSLLVSNLDSSILVGQLSGMIGKGVDWETTPSTDTVTTATFTPQTEGSGTITGVNITSGEVQVVVQSGTNSVNVSIGDITNIYEVGSDSEGTNTNSNSTTVNSANTNVSAATASTADDTDDDDTVSLDSSENADSVEPVDSTDS